MKQKPLLVAILVGLNFIVTGCAGGRARARDSNLAQAADPGRLLEQGRSYAAQGQSVRAEQYFVAAREAGADDELVFDLILETCVRAGRLGSALVHIDRRLKMHPDEPSLLRLSASLNEALGHQRLAWEHAERLSKSNELTAEQTLFLAEFYVRQGERGRGIDYYSVYLRTTSPSERQPWVAAAYRRLQASQGREVVSFNEVSP